ncbi:plastocyanin-like domain containing protein precursor [Zea mays]|uniref:Plastocyanin-like domain containing protein n=1 Tax=Zea mays TaxID=4577 RepID=K7TZW9_MAIZE|nr:plastocyanin-like domain containing protein precursor [Zea mays]AQK49768.1 Plastocyanin-like domain containing protein [Zea mays]
MLDMGIPTTVMFRVVVIAVFTLSTAAAAGNATASPSSVTNSTASSTKNTTAPLLPPFGTNHAVGDGAGWIFDWKANASAANYSAWAANRTFFLGDYLSFRTDTSNTVVHTTNATAYRFCSAGVAARGGGGGWKPEEAFLVVMLTAEGTNYFFSDALDGEHCRKGMRFQVGVAHGRGLPSVPPSYYEPLSGAPAGTRARHDGAVAVWGVAMVAAFAALAFS